MLYVILYEGRYEEIAVIVALLHSHYHRQIGILTRDQ